VVGLSVDRGAARAPGQHQLPDRARRHSTAGSQRRRPDAAGAWP